MAEHWSRKMVHRGRRVRLDVALRLDGIRRIAVSPTLRAATTKIVEQRALPYAVGISPFDEGTYLRSWEVAQGVEWRGGPPLPPMRRVSTRLMNTSFHATVVEVGRKNRSAHRVLAKTLEHLRKPAAPWHG